MSTRRYYTVHTLRAELDKLEDRFDMTSREFFERRCETFDVPGVDGFTANVWSGTYENWMRLAGIAP